MSLTIIWEVGLGALLALACIYLFRLKDRHTEILLWGNGLIVAALIYLVFALVEKEWPYVLIEVGGVLIYGLLVWAGRKYKYAFIPLGWILHMVWDTLLHIAINPGYAPAWYPDICIGFDAIIALYLFYTINNLKNG